MVGLAVLSVRRVCRDPVAELIRSVPARRTGVRLGVLEAMLVAAAGAAFIALVTGSVGGAGRPGRADAAGPGRRRRRRPRPRLSPRRRRPAAPAARAADRRRRPAHGEPARDDPLARPRRHRRPVHHRRHGGRARRRRPQLGRPGRRGGGGRERAQPGLGRPRGGDGGGARGRPGRRPRHAGRRPRADGAGRATTVAVVPDAFRRIALWPGVDTDALAWDRLTAPTVAPLVLTGTRVAYHVEAPPFSVVHAGRAAGSRRRSHSALRVVRADGTVEHRRARHVPGRRGRRRPGGHGQLRRRAAGSRGRCPRATVVGGGHRRRAVSRAHRRRPTGGPRRQPGRGATRSAEDASSTGTFADGALELGYANNGFDKAFLTHASVPDVVPALTTPAAAPSAAGATFGGSYRRRQQPAAEIRGRITFVPGGPPSAAW